MPPTTSKLTRYAAFLRAVNVGGTGKLPMNELRALCAELGFTAVRTYIASGNVALVSSLTAARTRAALETRLEAYAGKPVSVIIRTGAQLETVLKNNPWPDAEPSRTLVSLLPARPPADALDLARGQSDELLALGDQEIYVHYPSGQARSKLTIPAAKVGTARNINTLSKMRALLR